MSVKSRMIEVCPGVLLSALMAGISAEIAYLQWILFDKVWLEPIVLAIIVGVGLNTASPVAAHFQPGIRLSSKILLEMAIVLLGASISIQAVTSAGPVLLVGIAVIVSISGLLTYLIGRAFGLSEKLSALIACGNSICGNSAIVAVAPVLRATSQDVAASLAFTAALGIITVLALPLIYAYGGVSESQYGVIAGMSAYAVPQVLAATAPVGVAAVQIGTIVKLVRVMMLGPVVLLFGQFNRATSGPLDVNKFPGALPWFIVGFFLLMSFRSIGVVPDAVVPMIKGASNLLAVVAMAGLGLMVDVRDVVSAGGRVLATGAVSILLLVAMGYCLCLLLGSMA